MHIIAADIGGTKAHLVYAHGDRPDDIRYESRYESKDFEDFESLLSVFIQEAKCKALDILSLALPGVIDNDTARLTNLPWTVDKKMLIENYDVAQVHFMNDFQASALGVQRLAEQDCLVLNEGLSITGGVRVVVGAGTGLGMSWIQETGEGAVAHPTEAGHVDFAPAGDVQVRLLEYLARRYGHVSWERLLSGDGLVNLYSFISGTSDTHIDAKWINEQAARGDENARQAMRLFVRIYGAYVGNLALTFNPGAGIYITGGMAAKMIDWMRSADFLDAYHDKGRMLKMVKRITVKLVTNERVGVLGAISEAVKILGKGKDDN